jgi:hypothetical protein
MKRTSICHLKRHGLPMVTTDPQRDATYPPGTPRSDKTICHN